MRINTLDYLRGLMAFAIMIYHYSSWTFYHNDSSSVLGILGLYGVSIFYMLSGLTLFYVYNNKIDFSSLKSFFVKRVFRILPLLWLSIFVNFLFRSESYDFYTIAINLTGLFGFVDHSNYISTGSWSIGNEIVFYSIFPIIMILNKWKNFFVEVFFILSVIIAVYFAFYALSSDSELTQQWSAYINPLNQVFLFIGGMLIGKLIGSKKSNIAGLILLAITISCVMIYQVNGNQINIVTEWNRLIYSGLSFALTISFLLFDTSNILKPIDWIFSKLGHVSYSVYLLHPLVFWLLARFMNRMDAPYIYLTISISITLILSYFTYTYFELKLIKLGKRILAKN